MTTYLITESAYTPLDLDILFLGIYAIHILTRVKLPLYKDSHYSIVCNRSKTVATT